MYYTAKAMIQDRQEGGKFAPKSDEPRHVRSIRLTDTTWAKVGAAADKRRITRADLIEQMAEDGLFDDQVLEKGLGRDQVLLEVKAAIKKVLENSVVTRKGKDRGAIRKGLEALLRELESA